MIVSGTNALIEKLNFSFVLAYLHDHVCCRLLSAVEEERVKNEQKLDEAILRANDAHKEQMNEVMVRVEKDHQEKLEEALKNEQEQSSIAIQQSCEDERKKTNELLDQLKVWSIQGVCCL